MFTCKSSFKQSLAVILLISLWATPLVAQTAAGALRIQVSDQNGAVIVGASLTLIDAKGQKKTGKTGEDGSFLFRDLPPGTYTVVAEAKGFAAFENKSTQIVSGRREALDIKLNVALEEQKVDVPSDQPLSADPNSNASTLVLTGRDLESLPEDPDELEAALRALAGPSAGPDGGQIYIDGFVSTSRLPSRASIQEIRINQNPFAAENDRLGFGRIDVTTRPGAGKLTGQVLFSFNNEHLNSRNPYAPIRPPFLARTVGADLSGPIVKNRASFILMYDRRERQENAIINATILDPSLNITRFSDAVVVPWTQHYFRSVFDYQVNKSHSLSAQYIYIPTSRENVGIGEYSLPSRAYETSDSQHILRLTERAIFKSRIINQTLFQFSRTRLNQNADNSIPTIEVLDAFVDGGTQVGDGGIDNDRIDLSNHTTWAEGAHTFRAGARIRRFKIVDVSPTNFGGVFTFTGGLGPRLDEQNRVVLAPDGTPILDQISSIERYRRTLFFGQEGLSPAEIRELGGGAAQLTVAGGDPTASVSQLEFGAFFQDDWRVRPDFTFSFGLRYENQTNISSDLNFAPRLAFAWVPRYKAGQPSKMVVRGGVGIFYDRFGEGYTLRARRFNGIRQQQFVVSDPLILDQFPVVPSIDSLSEFAVDQTTIRVSEDLRTPYSIQSSISVELQLPHRTTMSLNYVNTRLLHMLRLRNINAPLPGTFIPGDPGSGDRPFGDVGNIFAYESTGIFKQNQLIVTFQNRLHRNVSFYGTYALNKANSDTDGAGTFPANPYDFTGEYGRSGIDIRNRLAFGGVVTMPGKVNFSPFVFVRSGIPFNVIIGRDINGDTLFNERPAFATNLSKPGILLTRHGAFDPNPEPGQTLIPRNFGDGPSFFGVNLAVSRSFSLFRKPNKAASAQPQGARPAQPSPESPYRLTVSVRAFNIFNRNNPGQPVGNLSSLFFGNPISPSAEGGFNNAGSNRRIWINCNFAF
jgi:hypothetical protein